MGTKAIDFDCGFTALGASLDLSGLALGRFVLSNKPGRIDKIVAMVRSVQEAGRITRAQAAEIQGHLNFASGFYMSRSLKCVLNKFDEVARQVDMWKSHLGELCELTITLLTSMPPREFTAEASHLIWFSLTEHGNRDKRLLAYLCMMQSKSRFLPKLYLPLTSLYICGNRRLESSSYVRLSFSLSWQYDFAMPTKCTTERL